MKYFHSLMVAIALVITLQALQRTFWSTPTSSSEKQGSSLFQSKKSPLSSELETTPSPEGSNLDKPSSIRHRSETQGSQHSKQGKTSLDAHTSVTTINKSSGSVRTNRRTTSKFRSSFRLGNSSGQTRRDSQSRPDDGEKTVRIFPGGPGNIERAKKGSQDYQAPVPEPRVRGSMP